MHPLLRLTLYLFALVFSVSAEALECTNIESWNANEIYNKPNTVKFENVAYQAKWWTRGDNPKLVNQTQQYPVWDKLGECGAPPPPPPTNEGECVNIAAWDKNTIYLKTDKVKFEAVIYQAKWWTRGDNPKINNSTEKYPVWEKLGPCSTTPPPTDTTPPVITLNGDNPASVLRNNAYLDPGATAIDDLDGSVAAPATFNDLDISTLGSYSITYTAVDNANNSSSKTRTVNVVADNSGTALKPFPQSRSYATLSKPSHKTQAQLNDELVKHYNLWKAGYLRESNGTTPGGGWYVRMNPNKSAKECAPIRSTTSEAHGYGMIIMALMAGQEAQAKKYFDGMYNIYDKHRSKINSNFMAWCLEQSEDSKFDTDSATDGDMDIAYSLLLADEQWGSSGAINYKAEAQRIISKGLKVSVMGPDDRIILGDWWKSNPNKWQYATRSSDWMTAHLRAYQKATGDAYWQQAIDRVYSIVETLRSNQSQATGLMPDFVVGKDIPVPAPPNLLEAQTDGSFSWNACRYPLRLAFDVAHFNNATARSALTQMVNWAKTSTSGEPSAFLAGYDLNGNALVNYTSMAFTAPLIAASAVAEGNHQTFVNKGWDTMAGAVGNDETRYYSNTIKLLSMLFISGNWWQPME